MKSKLKVVTAVVAASAGISAVATAASSPAVVTGSPTAVGQTSAVLHGTVNPNGSSTTYYFQWGLTTGYGVNGKARSAGSGTKLVSVHETAGGLIPGTTYHYRLVATNQFGTTVGSDRAFKTAGHPPPGVATGPANALNTTGATLTGAINPAGAATTWWFQWGATASYGQQTAAGMLAAGASAQNVASSLQGLLAPGTIYHYRLVASHGGAVTSFGNDGSFMTYPSPRPVPRVTGNTRPGRARHKPYVLSTSGSLIGPSWMPAGYRCSGNVTIRFFAGVKQVAFTLAGVQPNCAFSAQSVFTRKPLRKVHGPVRLRIVVRYVSTPYLATNRAGIEHVTLG
jgi:phosphodiesterase/alkaline phosphatase D-like protein